MVSFDFYAASLKAVPPNATDVIVAWSVGLSVCLSHLVHPAEAVGRNEMPFGRDTRVAPCDIVLGRGPGAARGRKGRFVGRKPSQNLHCKLRYR